MTPEETARVECDYLASIERFRRDDGKLRGRTRVRLSRRDKGVTGVVQT
jgi:hypothetical protein